MQTDFSNPLRSLVSTLSARSTIDRQAAEPDDGFLEVLDNSESDKPLANSKDPEIDGLPVEPKPKVDPLPFERDVDPQILLTQQLAARMLDMFQKRIDSPTA